MRLLFLLLISFVLCSYSLAQTLISSSCTTVSDGDCTIDWTIGDVVTATSEMGNMAATQGFLQPDIPTASSWALFILFLIFANCAVITLYQNRLTHNPIEKHIIS